MYNANAKIVRKQVIEHKEHRKYFFAINSEDWFLEISFAKVQKEWRNRMNDLISRKALIDILAKYKFGAIKSEAEREYTKETVMNFVKEQPTVEVVPVVHGEWVNEYINRYGHPCHCCSVCGFHASHQDKNFCPECGADMRKKVRYGNQRKD